MKSIPSAPVAALLIAAAFLPDARSTAATDTKATAALLQRLDREFMKDVETKGSKGYMSYYAEEAVEVPNGEAFVRGKSEIAKQTGYLDDKHNHLAWTPVGADVSASGDLGYTYGTYEFHSVDKNGKPSVSIGKYTTIWKLQKDGSWKVVLDMGNSSPGPKEPASNHRIPSI